MTSTSRPKSLFCVICGSKINDPWGHPLLSGERSAPVSAVACDRCRVAVAVPTRQGFHPRPVGKTAKRER